MKTRTGISTGSLYIVNPSRIIDVDGHFKKEKQVEMVHQTATFEQSNGYSIAQSFGIGQERYRDVFEKDFTMVHHEIERKYYDAKQLEYYGIGTNMSRAYFINVFDDDITPLADFVFGMGKTNATSRLRYFKHPFKHESMSLKKKYHLQQLAEKEEYTIEELKELQAILIEMQSPMQTAKKNYKIVREPVRRQFIHGSLFQTSMKYAGTKDDALLAFTKIIKESGRESRR